MSWEIKKFGTVLKAFNWKNCREIKKKRGDTKLSSGAFWNFSNKRFFLQIDPRGSDAQEKLFLSAIKKFGKTQLK